MKNVGMLLLFCAALSAANEHTVSVSLKGTFTTGTRFLYNIDRVNTYGEQREISSNLGYGADIRWNMLWDRFFLGFSAERISGRDERAVLYPQYNYLAVPYEEGFEVVAMELSGYYIVPISSERIQFYLGGGFGSYDGERNYSIARLKAETVASTSYIGIHVLTGIDYRFHSRIGLRFEIKFRDPHFDVTTKFDQSSVQYQGKRIPLPQTEEVTKVNLFGVNYMGGIVISL